MNINTNTDADIGPNSGLGFGNVMVKHEQELLQKQQLFQMSQYQQQQQQ